MIDGLWRIAFKSSVDSGGGLIVVTDEKVYGGDLGFTYVGSLRTSDGAHVTGEVRVQQYDTAVPSVIPGVTDYTLAVVGSAQNGTLNLNGVVKGRENLAIAITGLKVRSI